MHVPPCFCSVLLCRAPPPPPPPPPIHTRAVSHTRAGRAQEAMQAHWTSSRGRALARSSAHRRAWQVPPSRRCAATQQTALSYTERVFRSVDDEEKGAGGAGAGTSSWAALQRADAAWNQLKTGQAFSGARPAFVRVEPGQAPAGGGAPYDVVVCGGTLGVFIAAALAQRNLRVAVVERGPLQGRAQEWNISRKELGELVQVRSRDVGARSRVAARSAGANDWIC